MSFVERLNALHDRVAAGGGPVGRLLFGVRLPLFYPLVLAAVLVYLQFPPSEPAPVVEVPLPTPVAEVEVVPRVFEAPPMPAPVTAQVAPPAASPQPAPETPVKTPPPRAGNGNADWLLSLPPDGYTLQLLGSRHENTLRAFVRRHGLESMTAYYRTRHNGGDWYVLLYGLYTDRDEASVAVGTLPPAVRKNAPFPRTVQSVQQAIREGR